MNVNYLKLDRLPRFDEGWQPILDALRAGRFFVTTGEVLLESATIGGREGGRTLTARARRPARGPGRPLLDLPAPVRRGRLRRRLEGLPRAGRPVRHPALRPEDPDPQARPRRPDLGPVRGLGRRHRRGVHPAGLDRGEGCGRRLIGPLRPPVAAIGRVAGPGRALTSGRGAGGGAFGVLVAQLVEDGAGARGRSGAGRRRGDRVGGRRPRRGAWPASGRASRRPRCWRGVSAAPKRRL